MAKAKDGSHYLYIARVERDTITGQVRLTPGQDTDAFDLHQDDEFITIQTKVPLFEEDK